MSEAAVELESVSKAYGELTVLKALSLRLPVGRTTAIVGASGSGKTTLLQLINGLERADAGSVRIFGEPVPNGKAVQAFRRRIGYSVQGAGLFPHLCVRDNVDLIARLDGWSEARIEARRGALFAAMELTVDLGERFPHELSGGQQQRVGLCRSMMLEPDMLLLDEPFSAIDPITRVEVYRLFEQVQDSTPVSTVLVTHDMREAVRLADDLVILRDGSVLQHASAETVVQQPADDYVRLLVNEQL
ncbi:MAG: ATP-binding cassette domain-containing protein [Pseudomonadota bacterium]